MSVAEVIFGRNKHTVRAQQCEKLSKSGLSWCPTVSRTGSYQDSRFAILPL